MDALIEREEVLAKLQTCFEMVKNGEGHCVLVSGEAGIGKSSLVKYFCEGKLDSCTILQGMCDALFTPRPLAPLYDIALQMRGGAGLLQNNANTDDRAGLFTAYFNALVNTSGYTILVFEDIHWADEATLDFIKFLARRITRTRCLFILTYRDDEIHAHHPIKALPGQLQAGTFTRVQPAPLTRGAVAKMAAAKSYSGEDVYGIAGGNPFYVNEILAGYSPGVPDNVKDAIVAVYNRQPETTRQAWAIICIAPAGFELSYLEKMQPGYANAIAHSLDAKILLLREGRICFKHELYRRAVEAALPALERIALNKRVLALFLQVFAESGQTERIIHHARNADDGALIVEYGPVAAKQAAQVGSHTEACKLYLVVIEHYRSDNKTRLAEFYALYAYECYLTNRITEAIAYQEKLWNIIVGQSDAAKTGDCLRFLSRLCWYDGNRKKAEEYALKAIEVLEGAPPSSIKAMAYSNLSQLKMLSDEPADSIFWGEKAIAMAKGLGDEETLSHALNNVGTAMLGDAALQQQGKTLLQQSLSIAIANGYHEHAARAYTNLASVGVKEKNYPFAAHMLEEGIAYCEERDLSSWAAYMQGYKARLLLDTGSWAEASQIADNLVKNERQATIVKIVALTVIGTIQMRRGDAAALHSLVEAKTKAFETMELQRILPAAVAMLEYEWLTGKQFMDAAEIDSIIKMMRNTGRFLETSEFAFWLLKGRKQVMPLAAVHECYQAQNKAAALKAAAVWNGLGCLYLEAVMLFEAGEDEKRKALAMVQQLGAEAVYQKMKQEMRADGVKTIPRGIRKTTQANPALLTERETDVIKLLNKGMQDKEIAATLFISAKTVGHHISSILFKLDVNSRVKAVKEAVRRGIVNNQ